MAKIFRTNKLRFVRLHAQCLVCKTVASPAQMHVVSYLVPWLTLLIRTQCAHTHLNPFYHPFYPDVNHEKRYQALSCFTVLQVRETWAGFWNEGMREEGLVNIVHNSIHQNLLPSY